METTREPGKVKNESGMTLVELLAALALVSLVVILINTVFFFTQRNADSLSTESDVQENLLLAMKVVTKDVRSADQVKITDSGLVLNEKDTYAANGGALMKNGNPVAQDIVSFKTCHPPTGVIYEEDQLTCKPIKTENADKDRIIIILQGPDNRAGNHRTLATEINLIR